MTPTYADYDPLAWFYDRHWGSRFHQHMPAILDQLLPTAVGPGSPVLDLCCGTGHLSEILAGRGYQVTGVDGSSEMLRYARRRVPEAIFECGDARAFRFPSVFQAVLSTFESLNHIMSLDDLEQVFRRVHETLTPGGAFIFDLLTEETYRTEWHKSSAVVEDDNVCIIVGGYDENSRTGRVNITAFRQLDGWRRYDVALAQRCHDLDEVRGLLEHVGFESVEHFAARRELGMAGEIGTGRVFFRALKSFADPSAM